MVQSLLSVGARLLRWVIRGKAKRLNRRLLLQPEGSRRMAIYLMDIQSLLE